MDYRFRNVNDAFLGLVWDIYRLADNPELIRQTGSRAGVVRLFRRPVTVTYEKPLERVLFNRARDANPFFHLFESLWMLAGRRDVAPLAYYNSQISEIASDDGTIFNGAYGHRWRTRGGIDQLPIIIDQLKRKPESRRCVLQMWTVKSDLLRIDTTKDNCCLSWDTKFRSPEGILNIQELAKRFQNHCGYKFPVYSVDTQTGDQRLCWMTNAWKVGTKSTLKITLDDGSSIRLTSDHKVFRKKKLFEGRRCVGVSIEECVVGDLVKGDRLLSANGYTITKGGYRQFKRNLFKNTAYSNLVLEHREYLSMFRHLGSYSGKDGRSVHHKNGNKLDNCLHNLIELDNHTHFSHDKFGKDNPHNKMSVEAKAARGRKHSMSIKAHWDSMDKETRCAYASKKDFRTEKQWELITLHQSTKSNHRIVSIQNGGETAVFDFTVPGRHNAVLSNGIIVHNCNTHAYFAIQDGELDMTVCNRSNDMIWGMLGANVVHFSFLLEYMAACIGVKVGVYNHFTNNLHVYLDRFEPEKWIRDKTKYDYDICTTVPLVNNPAVFDAEVAQFIDNKDWTRVWQEPFLNTVAAPMCWAFELHKRRDYRSSLNAIETIVADDWRFAARNWIWRRKVNWENKNA